MYAAPRTFKIGMAGARREKKAPLSVLIMINIIIIIIVIIIIIWCLEGWSSPRVLLSRGFFVSKCTFNCLTHIFKISGDILKILKSILKSRKYTLTCFGWHYLSNTTCPLRPHVFYALLVVSRTMIVRYIIHRV